MFSVKIRVPQALHFLEGERDRIFHMRRDFNRLSSTIAHSIARLNVRSHRIANLLQFEIKRLHDPGSHPPGIRECTEQEMFSANDPLTRTQRLLPGKRQSYLELFRKLIKHHQFYASCFTL